MTDSKLIDSSVWLDYLFNKNHREIIESEEILFLSSLSIFEIKRKLIKSKIERNKIDHSLEFIKKKSLIIPLEKETAENAVEISIKNNLPAIDAMIYATATAHNSLLITIDNDFRGLKDVLVL